MKERWMKAGASGLPHWIKLWGDVRLTTACGTLLARESALDAETQRIGLANAPGKHVDLPVEAHCQDCAEKAKRQA